VKYSVAALLTVAISSIAEPATLRHEPLGDGIELITITGDIVSGDEAKFSKLAVEYNKAAVLLESDGGQLMPALEIGKAIHLREYSTIVDTQCASACALIWVAGTKRLLTDRGKVGFHASYMETNGRRIESSVANALVGRYLTQLELPERSIVYATSAGPNSIQWLRAADQSTSGIDFKVLQPTKTGSAAAPPPVISATSSIPKTTTDRASIRGWRVSVVGKEGGVDFVNTDEILRSDQMVQFWHELWWSKLSPSGVNRSVELVRANCTDKSFTALKTNYYYYSQPLRSTGQEATDYAAPGTINEGIITAVCTGKYLSGAVADRETVVSSLRSAR
jgi:hypothetical protein